MCEGKTEVNSATTEPKKCQRYPIVGGLYALLQK